MLDMVRHMVFIRHMLVRRMGMPAVSAILRLGRPRTQGCLPPGPRGGGIVSTGRVGRDMHGNAVSVVRTGEPGHGGGCAGQAKQAEAKEVGELHFEGTKDRYRRSMVWSQRLSLMSS